MGCTKTLNIPPVPTVTPSATSNKSNHLKPGPRLVIRTKDQAIRPKAEWIEQGIEE